MQEARDLSATGFLELQNNSTSLAMSCGLVALCAELLDRKTIRRVATVLLGNVVALLALLTSEGDLGANILRLASHCSYSSGPSSETIDSLRICSGGGV